jgi:DNA-binding transcriptional regulator PaaX
LKIDNDRIDDAVLALLQLVLHEDVRAWKGFDRDTLNRLHAKGWISDPRTNAKSVVLTDEGLEKSERLFNELFTRSN